MFGVRDLLQVFFWFGKYLYVKGHIKTEQFDSFYLVFNSYVIYVSILIKCVLSRNEKMIFCWFILFGLVKRKCWSMRAVPVDYLRLLLLIVLLYKFKWWSIDGFSWHECGVKTMSHFGASPGWHFFSLKYV